jgi:two-component system phosphate regulon response regulator PhoB
VENPFATLEPSPAPIGSPREPSSPPKTVLVVDDEPDVIELVAFHLGRAGYRVISAETGAKAHAELRRARPDLVILDLMLPDLSGLEILKELAQRDAELPVIVLSARTGAEDRVLGFELGATDYVPKPFSPRELVLRVRAVLARSLGGSDHPLEFGPLRIDRTEHRVTVDGSEAKLTATEFRLLIFLVDHGGRVHERDRLLDLVWGTDVFVGPRTVDAHIANLRGKLGRAGTMIQTVRGFGYRFAAPDPAPKTG